MPIVHVKSDSDFRKALSSGKLVVIDFYADWCGPCKAIAPRFEELSEQYKGVIFLKVNVDEHTQISQECEITAMPTFQLYRSNKKLDQIVGANIRGVENSIQRYKGESSGFPQSGGRVLGTGAAVGATGSAAAAAAGETPAMGSFAQNALILVGLTLFLAGYVYVNKQGGGL